MDSASMNHYEKQLYTVFKTFDVDNEEALDRCAVLQLCDALQLEDRGSTLVDTLFERRTDRVTFTQFRNGLLAVLGGGDSAPGPLGQPPPSANASSDSPAAPPDLPAPHSDEDSSGREVAPKFVFGSKKYGRRSRPQRASDEPPSPRAASASRLDTDDKRARQRMRCRRSASAMESREDSVDVDDDVAPTAYDHDRRIDRNQAFAMCRHLRMDSIDRQLIERIFENFPTAETTVGEFFDRLNASLTTSMEEARDENADAADSLGTGEAADDDTGAGVASELVVDAWERAGVRRPRRLLVELGFASAALRPTDLERALDDELRALPGPPDGDARAALLAAALALSRLRHGLARRDADVAAAERNKLRADVAEANRRARLLAQEVDESHARIETELKASLRRAERRHAEAARLAAAEAQMERERAGEARVRLEAEAARRGEAEARARAEAAALRARLQEAEALAAAAEERSVAAERERARLAAEARAAASLRCAEEAAGRGAAGELAQCVEELRRENQALRDRNDELCAELEARARSVGGAVGPGGDELEARGGDLSTELDSVLIQDHPEEKESPPASEQKGWHDDEMMQFHQILEKLEQSASGASSCACGALRPLAARLRPALRRLHDEPLRLAALVRELEASLEQMKAEYDKCEEYWRGKLDEEREAHCEEQRLGDERLADLVAEIGEYERQFAARALPTIDEKRGLEAQFTQLEDELAQHRRDAEAELRRRDEDAARLRDRLRQLELERRPPPPPAPHAPPAHAAHADPTRAEGGTAPAAAAPGGGGRCACAALAERCRRLAALAGDGEVRELRARLARAEAAVRRLHARLAAADVLVKDLYVENCHLAYRPARPL